MVTSQIFESMDFTKTQKFRYLKNKTLFFLQIKKFINYSSRTTLWQNSFVVEVTFNTYYRGSNTTANCKGDLS